MYYIFFQFQIPCTNLKVITEKRSNAYWMVCTFLQSRCDQRRLGPVKKKYIYMKSIHTYDRLRLWPGTPVFGVFFHTTPIIISSVGLVLAGSCSARGRSRCWGRSWSGRCCGSNWGSCWGSCESWRGRYWTELPELCLSTTKKNI